MISLEYKLSKVRELKSKHYIGSQAAKQYVDFIDGLQDSLDAATLEIGDALNDADISTNNLLETASLVGGASNYLFVGLTESELNSFVSEPVLPEILGEDPELDTRASDTLETYVPMNLTTELSMWNSLEDSKKQLLKNSLVSLWSSTVSSNNIIDAIDSVSSYVSNFLPPDYVSTLSEVTEKAKASAAGDGIMPLTGKEVLEGIHKYNQRFMLRSEMMAGRILKEQVSNRFEYRRKLALAKADENPGFSYDALVREQRRYLSRERKSLEDVPSILGPIIEPHIRCQELVLQVLISEKNYLKKHLKE